MKKKCTKCKTVKPVTSFRRRRPDKEWLSSWCVQCHYDFTSDWAKRNKRKKRVSVVKYQKTEKGKEALRRADKKRNLTAPLRPSARLKARNAATSGKITKQPCEVCGDTGVEMHHDDYTKPLEVRFLCKKHHLLLHGMVQVQSG